MRCLYCNKKLSLLKLAKGDSFCSPQHFDAYQLQLSKNAYERLASVPEDVPKPALVFKPVEAPAEPDAPPAEVQAQPVELDALTTEVDAQPGGLEADSAMARLSAYRAPEQDQKGAASKEPPYAPFLAQPVPSLPPSTRVPVAGEQDAGEPVELPWDLAFPVHDVQATVCILNLYLRLGLSDTPPKDWTSALHALAAPESFPVEITRPRLEVQTDGELFEDRAAGERVAPEEIQEPAAQVIPVKAAQVPGLEMQAPGHRVAFLTAPSFRERAGEEVPFDAAASSAPCEWMPPPVLHPAKFPGAGWSGWIPQSSGFARNASVRPADAAGERIQSHSATEVWMSPMVPSNGSVERRQWRPVSDPAGIAHPPAETRWTSTTAVDFTPATGAAVLPSAALPPDIDRSWILTAAATPGSLFRAVLERGPRGQEQVFLARPMGALKFSLPPTLAAPSGWERCFSGTWQNEPILSPLSFSIADGFDSTNFPPEPLAFLLDSVKQDPGREPVRSIAQLAYVPMAWPGSDVALPRSGDPAPANSMPAIRFLAPVHFSDQPALLAAAFLGTPFEHAFIPATSADFGGPDFRMIASKRLPAAARVVFPSKIGLCGPTATWNPSAPTTPAAPLLKLLPARRSPILPSARSWPRLGAPSL